MSTQPKLKVGSKVQVLRDVLGFSKGQIVALYKIEEDGIHLFRGDAQCHITCDGLSFAFLSPNNYRVLSETVAHLHADLMLKYAQIAHYDDKPWESFEFLNRNDEWITCTSDLSFNLGLQLRLKPQPQVVQVGQTWVSSEHGIEVTVVCADFRIPDYRFNKVRAVKLSVGLYESINLKSTLIMEYSKFLSHFKHKA